LIVEEPFSFTIPSDELTKLEKFDLIPVTDDGNNVDKVEGEIGDGCYVSCTVHRRRYYGVLIDQNALRAASNISLKDEAESIQLNRRMMVLMQQKRSREEDKEE